MSSLRSNYTRVAVNSSRVESIDLEQAYVNRDLKFILTDAVESIAAAGKWDIYLDVKDYPLVLLDFNIQFTSEKIGVSLIEGPTNVSGTNALSSLIMFPNRLDPKVLNTLVTSGDATVTGGATIYGPIIHRGSSTSGNTTQTDSVDDQSVVVLKANTRYVFRIVNLDSSDPTALTVRMKVAEAAITL